MKNPSKCSVTGEIFEPGTLIQADTLRKPIFDFIKADHPDFDYSSQINSATLNVYRKKYLESMVKEEFKDLDRMEKEVISSIEKNEILSSNIEIGMLEKLTTGQRVADKIASFGGSWTFIISFFSFIMVWISANTWLSAAPFDVYPFILLNLLLSCLAAIQAPIIMMSQNRKEEKDRNRSENDFKVNLKAELEIRMLHEKIDHMIMHQNQKLLEIQQIQMDCISEILAEVKNKN